MGTETCGRLKGWTIGLLTSDGGVVRSGGSDVSILMHKIFEKRSVIPICVEAVDFLDFLTQRSGLAIE